jgi:transketolase
MIRPADANETAIAWRVALENNHGPTALALTRQKLPVFDRSKYASAEGLTRGAYVMGESPTGRIDAIIIATGSEVSVAVEAQDKLAAQDIGARVVSMPCWGLFEKQPQAYRDEVLPPAIHARLAIEAGVTLGWEKYVGEKGDVIGIDRYGASAPVQAVMEKLGFTAENAVERVKKMLGK